MAKEWYISFSWSDIYKFELSQIQIKEGGSF